MRSQLCLLRLCQPEAGSVGNLRATASSMKEATPKKCDMNMCMMGYCTNFSCVNNGLYPITAANKTLVDLDENYYYQRGFQTKRVKHWSSIDVINWFYNVIEVEEKKEISESKLHSFDVDGATLLDMSEDEFKQRDPLYGHIIFTHLQKRLNTEYANPDLFTLFYEIRGLNDPISTIQPPVISPTAAGKTLDINDFDLRCETDWTSKRISDWSHQDITAWTLCTLGEENLNADDFILPGTNFTGEKLLKMTVNDFVSISPRYGQLLFNRLQQLKKKKSSPEIRSDSDGSTDETEGRHSDFRVGRQEKKPGSDSDDSNDDNDGRRCEARGGLRRKKPGGHGRLWLFVRNLLKSRRFPEVIDWIDYDKGVFRVKDSKRLAELWGAEKNNARMTYEKMARAMRFNYRSGYLRCVKGRKLVFAFGPNAMGWQETPSLSQQYS